MAAITNIRVHPATGPMNPLVTFANGDQDQGGTIDVPSTGNVTAGNVDKLRDDGTYRIIYTSAGNNYTVKKKLEGEYNSTVLHFVNCS